MRVATPLPTLLVAVACVAACAGGGADDASVDRAVPVALGPVEHGPITLRRTLYGTLEASAQLTVTTVVSGRIATMPVALGDPVRSGQVVATLDRDDVGQAVRQATASLAVAQANAAQTGVQADIATRALERARTLRAAGAIADAELDDAASDAERARAQAEVAQAEVTQAQASVATARVKLDDTAIVARWDGDDVRYVAARRADPGTIVSANTALLTIVDTDPLRAVVHVTERDHTLLHAGQAVTLSTDAHPGSTFTARVDRVAPVFDPDSRQARVELVVDNPDGRLSPGGFVRADVVLDTVDDATVVPVDALVTRDDATVVFVLDADGTHVAQRPVTVGIRDGDRVAVTGTGIDGQVVVLGQQQLRDGSAVVVPVGEDARGEAAAEGG